YAHALMRVVHMRVVEKRTPLAILLPKHGDEAQCRIARSSKEDMFIGRGLGQALGPQRYLLRRHIFRQEFIAQQIAVSMAPTCGMQIAQHGRIKYIGRSYPQHW